MVELKQIIKHAIQNQELHMLMLGIGDYSKYHDPLHAFDIVETVYSLYGEIPGIDYTFEKAIADMINKLTPESFYIGAKYIMAIYDSEYSGKNTFTIRTTNLTSLLHKSYSVNKAKLIKLYELPKIGVKCSTGKGDSKENNLKAKFDMLNDFSKRVYNKSLI